MGDEMAFRGAAISGHHHTILVAKGKDRGAFGDAGWLLPRIEMHLGQGAHRIKKIGETRTR
jgi:hypothetical protein